MRFRMDSLFGLIILSMIPAVWTWADVIHVADYGAIPDDDRDDSQAVQRAINDSRPEDTIRFASGTYDLHASLHLRSGQTYLGENTTLRAHGIEFAARLQPDVADVEIRRLRFVGAGLYLGDGKRYRDIRIMENSFEDMPEHAIKMTIESDRVVIERNTFRNIRGYGTTLAYFTNRLSYRFNRFIDCAHGGHFLAPLNDCVFAFNHMTGLTNMGLEIQAHGGSVARNMIVEGNVIHDWRSTHSHAMGLSVPTSWSINTMIRDNYINGNLAPGHTWLKVPGRHPCIGTMIEAIYDSGAVRNNVLGGTYWFCIGAGTTHDPPKHTSLIEANRFYGRSIRRAPHIVAWPGSPQSPASWSTGSGNQVLPADQMPAPQPWIENIQRAMRPDAASVTDEDKR